MTEATTQTEPIAITSTSPIVVVSTVAAPPLVRISENVDRDYEVVETDIKADIIKARMIAARFGLVFLGLLAGWVLAKIF